MPHMESTGGLFTTTGPTLCHLIVLKLISEKKTQKQYRHIHSVIRKVKKLTNNTNYESRTSFRLRTRDVFELHGVIVCVD